MTFVTPNSQQFVFNDTNPPATLPGLIFSSRFNTLSDAVTAASSVNGILVVDQDWALAGSITLDCDVMAGGGLLSCPDGDTISATGRVIGNSQIFDVTGWGGDPTLTGAYGSRAPTHAFPVLITQCTDINAAWFGACTIPNDMNRLVHTRKILQAAFCSVGAGTGGAMGATVRIPGGYTYQFDRNDFYDGNMTVSALPYGVLIPEQRDITIFAEGAVFDYQGSEYEAEGGPAGLGTCAFAWFSNESSFTYYFAGMDWRGGQALPSDVRTNSDFLWFNNQASRAAIHALQIGQEGDTDEGTTGHRHGIVQCDWTGDDLTGQRIVIDNCDIAQCTDTGIIIVECDALLVTGCRIRFNLGSGVELGCEGFRSFNGQVQDDGTCSSPKVIACNFEENGRSGVKCISVRNSYISADFESNAMGFTNSDANVDFSGLFDLPPGTGVSTGTTTISSLTFDPVARGWLVGMIVKDSTGKIPANTTITGATSTTLTLSAAVPAQSPITVAAFLGSGDREGMAQACTWSNSHTTGNAFNVITQTSTLLDDNLHKGQEATEIGVLHLSFDQPLWCTTDVFTGTLMTKFSSASWPGGIVTRESAVSCMLKPATAITRGSTAAIATRLTPFFSLDGQSVMVEAGGLINSTTLGVTTAYRTKLCDSTGTVIQTLTGPVGTTPALPWVEGSHVTQRVGPRLAHLTSATVSGWTAGTYYAVYAFNQTSGSGTDPFDGGVIIRYCPVVPT